MWVTKQVPGIGKCPYETRREICHLNTIEERLIRGIAIETFKFQNGSSGLSPDRLQMINRKYGSRSISSNNIYQVFAKTDKRKILLSVGHHLFGEIFRRRLKMLVVQIPSKIHMTAGNLSQNIEAFIC